MFTSTITRPLRWAIPLAVIAGIVAVLWYLRPLETSIGGEPLRCPDITISLAGGANPCTIAFRTRFLVTGLIMVIGGLPLLIVAVRACVLAADSIAALRDDVRRLHERLDGER
jgi:hypothetical protein